jgi:hypothetical protein
MRGLVGRALYVCVCAAIALRQTGTRRTSSAFACLSLQVLSRRLTYCPGGIIDRPPAAWGLAAALRKAAPAMQAVVGMVTVAEAKVRPMIGLALAAFRARHLLSDAMRRPTLVLPGTCARWYEGGD